MIEISGYGILILRLGYWDLIINKITVKRYDELHIYRYKL